MKMTSSLSIYFSRFFLIKTLVSSIILLIAGVSCLKADTVLVKVLGGLNLIMGAVSFLAFIRSLIRRARIVMDEKGILDYRVAKKYIPWDQIQDLELTFKGNQKVLKITIANNFANDNFKWLYKIFNKSNLNKKPKVVLIALIGLVINYESLNEFLLSRDINYTATNLDEQLSALERGINKVLY